jgi:hypothetical protein
MHSAVAMIADSRAQLLDFLYKLLSRKKFQIFIHVAQGLKIFERRTACLNTRQFILAAHLYAGDHEEFLPPADTDNLNKNDTHTAILSNATKSNLLRYVGHLRVLD